MAFFSFHGVNTSGMANFQLQTWSHYSGSWEVRLIVLDPSCWGITLCHIPFLLTPAVLRTIYLLLGENLKETLVPTTLASELGASLCWGWVDLIILLSQISWIPAFAYFDPQSWLNWPLDSRDILHSTDGCTFPDPPWLPGSQICDMLLRTEKNSPPTSCRVFCFLGCDLLGHPLLALSTFLLIPGVHSYPTDWELCDQFRYSFPLLLFPFFIHSNICLLILYVTFTFRDSLSASGFTLSKNY